MAWIRSVRAAAVTHGRLAWTATTVAAAVVSLVGALATLVAPATRPSSVIRRAIPFLAILLPMLGTGGLWRGRDGTPLNRLLLAGGHGRGKLFGAVLLARIGPALAVAAASLAPCLRGESRLLTWLLALGVATQLAALSAFIGIWTRDWHNVALTLALLVLTATVFPVQGSGKVA